MIGTRQFSHQFVRWRRRMRSRDQRSVMCRAVAVTLIAISFGAAPRYAFAEMRVASPVEALHQGVSTYLRGQYELAVPALEAATKARNERPELRSKLFFAPFYLARIYSGMHPAYIDHARAFELYNGIVKRHALNGPEHVDLNNLRHAPAVAKAMTEAARYLLRGIPEASIRPNRRLAMAYLTHAANIYGEEDAQFELAKLDLRAESTGRTRTALSRLWRLASLRCHAGALVTLADMIMRKQHTDFLVGSRIEALALAERAMKCAPDHERMWIEGVYQNIYCKTDENERDRASTVMGFSARFGGHRQTGGVRTGLEGLGLPSRVCPNGDQVPTLQQLLDRGAADGAQPRRAIDTPSRQGEGGDGRVDGIIIADQQPAGVMTGNQRPTSPSSGAPGAANQPMFGTLFSLGLNGETPTGTRIPAGAGPDAGTTITPQPGINLITPVPSN